MKYISFDLETTGLDPRHSQVLQAAMVLEDTEQRVAITELPSINIFFRNKFLQGEHYAMNMNRQLIDRCEKEGTNPDDAWFRIGRWLNHQRVYPHSKVVLAGKNVGAFDLQFCPGILRAYFHHRIIDVGSVFIDWGRSVPPSLGDLSETKVTHDALADAQQVIEVLRGAYHGV